MSDWPLIHAALLRRRADDIAAQARSAPPKRAAHLWRLWLRNRAEAVALAGPAGVVCRICRVRRPAARRKDCASCIAANLAFCPRCAQAKPAAAFGPPEPGRAAKGARTAAYCRACVNAHKPHEPCAAGCGRPRTRAKLCAGCRAAGLAWCPACERARPLIEFGRQSEHPKRRGTRPPYCMDCDAARKRSAYQRRKEAA